MSNHRDYTAPADWTRAFAQAGVFDPCEHENMSTSFEDSNLWSCDDCGTDVPKTAEEIDWFRTDGVPTCVVCGHSEQFGGPMTERTPWLSKHPQTFHVSCLAK